MLKVIANTHFTFVEEIFSIELNNSKIALMTGWLNSATRKKSLFIVIQK
jgi:hypothetical protein